MHGDSTSGFWAGGTDRPGFHKLAKTSSSVSVAENKTWYQKDAAGFRSSVKWDVRPIAEPVSSPTSEASLTKDRCAISVQTNGTATNTGNPRSTAILGTDIRYFRNGHQLF